MIGKLENDPEVRFTVEGIQIAKFQLAVERFSQEGSPKQVDHIDIVAWRRLAEICGQYLKHGKPVLVEGRIQVRSFENENGVRRWTTEVVARSIKMLALSKSEGQPAGTKETAAAAIEAEPRAAQAEDEIPGLEELPEEESDLPF